MPKVLKKTKVGNAKEKATLVVPAVKKPTKSSSSSGGGGGVQRVSWNERFQECTEYRNAVGHCKIPTNFKDNKGLGIWVQEQRRKYKRQKLGKKVPTIVTDEQIKMLDGIGFHWGFTPDPNSAESDASWQANLERLKEYNTLIGDFDVPLDTDDSAMTALGKWTRAQRNQFLMRETKRKTFMTKDRAAKLTEIDFDWDGPRTWN